MKIYLHIGAGKCASSTIQNYFSYHYANGGFSYGCLREGGEILYGSRVKHAAMISPGNYGVSWSLKSSVDDEFKSQFRESLKKISKTTETLLLSSEGWSNKVDLFGQMESVFEGFDVAVIMIVRPPVLWMNSAWWQWQQWMKVDLDSWANRANVAHRWLSSYQSFKRLSYVSEIQVLALNPNILKDVGGILGVEIQDSDRKHNSASSSELLNFFKMKRSLRPDAHEPQSEFVLNKYLRKRSPSDWVLTAENIENILSNSRSSCQRLAKVIKNEDITKNSLWWELDAYDDKIDKLRRNRKLNRVVLASMLEEAYQVIIDLDKDKRIKNLEKDHVSELINIASSIENNNIEEAYRLLKIAQAIRPNG
uniref:hypothetical protein n=1 Tax=Pseudoalteromonas marina TaxID=267375 RepID=UPI0023F13DD1